MTPADLSGQSSDTMDRAEFEIKLQQLITAARDDGVQPAGAYDVQLPHQEDQDYQVEITSVRKRPPEWMQTNE